MLPTYISAVLVCAASLLVGRSMFALIGKGRWNWLEPAVGLAALFTVAGFFARFPGHATTAAVFVIALLVAALVSLRLPYARDGMLRTGLPVAVAVALVLAIPFAVSARWGLIGVGFNNDLGLHLQWAEWLKNGLGPAPDRGYPLGPHGLSTTLSLIPGVGLDKAFTGLVVAIPIITALTAVGALRELGAVRRTFGAVMVALAYLAVSYYSQSAFKETAEALFVLAFAIALPAAWPLPTDLRGRLRMLGPLAVLAAGIVFSYSVAGMAWPLAAIVIYALTFPEFRRGLAPRRLWRTINRPAVWIGAVVVAVGVLLFGVVGPFGFGKGVAQVKGANTFGPVNPAEALGFWTSANYRLDTAGGAHLPWLTSAIGALALVAGLAWWLRRREYAIPAALAGGILIYLATLTPASGEYVRGKALMIIAPLVMLIIVRALLSAPAPEVKVPRLAWSALAVVFLAGAAYSSLLVLRDTPIGPPGHGIELRAFTSQTAGKSVLYAGQDRFAQWELRGADTHIPLIEFQDALVRERATKPFDLGVGYSPIDFDSFTPATLDRFDYVVTTRAAFQSKAPPNFRRVAKTASYVLWKRVGPTSRKRETLLEGADPGQLLDCAAPETKIMIDRPGTASDMPTPVIGPKESWDNGPSPGLGNFTSQSLNLPAGNWDLSLQYFSPVAIQLRAPAAGLDEHLPAALDGQRPNQISLINDGQYWPAGRISLSTPQHVRFTISVAKPTTLQSIVGYDARASLGELTARPVGRERRVPLTAACGSWVDFYSGGRLP